MLCHAVTSRSRTWVVIMMPLSTPIVKDKSLSSSFSMKNLQLNDTNLIKDKHNCMCFITFSRGQVCGSRNHRVCNQWTPWRSAFKKGWWLVIYQLCCYHFISGIGHVFCKISWILIKIYVWSQAMTNFGAVTEVTRQNNLYEGCLLEKRLIQMYKLSFVEHFESHEKTHNHSEVTGES